MDDGGMYAVSSSIPILPDDFFSLMLLWSTPRNSGMYLLILAAGEAAGTSGAAAGSPPPLDAIGVGFKLSLLTTFAAVVDPLVPRLYMPLFFILLIF